MFAVIMRHNTGNFTGPATDAVFSISNNKSIHNDLTL